MIHKRYRKCPICGNSDVSLRLKATTSVPVSAKQIQVTDKYFGLHGDIVTCGKCGFNYVGELNYIKKVISLYAKMSDETYLNEEKERKKSFINVLMTLNELRGGKRGKLLDIGCCTGGLLIEAKKMGWNIEGVDPSKWAYDVAKRVHGITINNLKIEDYKKHQLFDVITILDVLEHVEDPHTLLKKIRQLLKKTGILCIVTPNFGSLTAKILGKKWWGIRIAHLSYFTENDLKKLFTDTGFTILKSKTYIRYFSLYYLLVRLFPFIEDKPRLKSILKHTTLPLAFFDTYEIYLKRENGK